MIIPKEIIKTTVDGYHILRTDVQYIFDKPIECIIEGSALDYDTKRLLKAIIPQADFGIICTESSFCLSCTIKVRVEKEPRQMSCIQMANYCFQESLRNKKVLFVKSENGHNEFPYWMHNFSNLSEQYLLTWDGIKFFKFPMVKD